MLTAIALVCLLYAAFVEVRRPGCGAAKVSSIVALLLIALLLVWPKSAPGVAIVEAAMVLAGVTAAFFGVRSAIKDRRGS